MQVRQFIFTNVHVYIFTCYTGLQEQDPGWYQHLTAHLNMEQQKKLQDVFALADQRKAAAESKKIEESGGNLQWHEIKSWILIMIFCFQDTFSVSKPSPRDLTLEETRDKLTGESNNFIFVLASSLTKFSIVKPSLLSLLG